MEEETPEYRREDLVGIAAEMGLTDSGRLLDDWIHKGLVASPFSPGRGQAAGREVGTWSPEQVGVFRIACEGRARGASIPYLCNLPVFIWFVHGEGAVPLTQVRRAMATWVGKNRSARSKESARQSARELLERFDHPEATSASRDELLRLLREDGQAGRLRKETAAALQKVFDPNGEGRWRGASGLELTPHDYVNFVRGQIEVRKKLEDPKKREISDESLRTARLVLAAGLVDYRRGQPAAAADPTISSRYPPLGPSTVLETACLALVTMVALGLMAQRKSLPRYHAYAAKGEALLLGFENAEDFARGMVAPDLGMKE